MTETFSRLTIWLRFIKNGKGLKDKFNLTCAFLLLPIPPTVLRRCSFLWMIREKLRIAILTRTTIKINGCLYSLIDTESLYIISSEFEPYLDSFFQLTKNEVFIDVGAHIGKYTISAAKRCKLVIAIEPMPLNYLSLLRNLKLNGLNNVIPLNVAAWKDDCKIPLYIADGSGLASIKKNSGLGSIEVDAKSVDNIFKGLNCESVDLVKIDVEEAEYEVLEGMRNILLNFFPRLIIEISKKNVNLIYPFLKELRYRVLEIKESETKKKIYIYCS